MESPGLSAVVADTAQSAEFIVCRPAEGAGQSKSRLCSKSCARSPRKYFLFLLSPCGGDDLLVDHVPTNVAISLRRDEPYAMHTALPKPAAIVKQRGQSSVTDRLGVSSALGWLQGLVSTERDGYVENRLVQIGPVSLCNHKTHERAAIVCLTSMRFFRVFRVFRGQPSPTMVVPDVGRVTGPHDSNSGGDSGHY